ncbi:MAG: hypothetical protein LBH54_00415 [Clostridiales bacterium]|jgi:hypothetical protein|nr:hypothetical protein [Clostridiales bacterium]
MLLIWYGLRLFILGLRISVLERLVIWRQKRARTYTEPLLVWLDHRHAGLCARFLTLEKRYNEQRKKYQK